VSASPGPGRGSGPSPTAAPEALSRRGLLGLTTGVVGVGLLAGCDLDPGSSSAPPVARTDPDQRLVETARAELRGLIGRLRATDGAAGLVAAHRAQLAALEGRPPASHRRRPLSEEQTVALERRAAERFRHWALVCDNGDLARVLASIAAGIRSQPTLRNAS
jgi:hypothetical protein